MHHRGVAGEKTIMREVVIATVYCYIQSWGGRYRRTAKAIGTIGGASRDPGMWQQVFL